MHTPSDELKSPLSLFVAINEGSGADADDLPAKVEGLLKSAGHQVTMFEIPKGADLAEACQPLIEKALAVDGIVVAAGGDGTVNGIAKLCYQHKLRLAIIPLGTFNYFARALEIPNDLEKAVKAIETSKVRTVSAGFIQDHLFLNNASFGLYPKLIKKREAATARFGRKRIIAGIAALHSLFERQECFAVNIKTGESTHQYQTNMVFVGNNSFQLDTLGLDVTECAKQNRLGVVILKTMNRWHMARLIWKGIVKNLQSEPKLEQFCADAFEIETQRSSLEMVIDGEIIRCTTPLSFRVEADAIQVLAPKPEAA